MQDDINNPVLETHKLSGNLIGLWALSCGFDCRIIFRIEKSLITNENVILLIDFGTHNEVY